MSRRLMDMRAESELAKFLDDKFWTPWCRDYEQFSFKRIVDRNLQLQGVDVEVFDSTNNQKFFIDEKAQLYYINNTLPTFAFEINSFQNGILRDGWLLNATLMTTDYNLIYPNAKHCDLASITKDDFTRVKILSIKKKNLLEALAVNGLTREYLEREAARIRAISSSATYRENTICPFVRFVRSASYQYSEAPLNIVVRNDFLRKIADCEVEVSQDGYKIIFDQIVQ